LRQAIPNDSLIGQGTFSSVGTNLI
jgi:hypothetical protein